MRRLLPPAFLGFLAGLGLSALLAGPAFAGYVASSPVAFTYQLIGDHGTSYCGRAQAKIGDSANPADTQAFTRAAYWYATCDGTPGVTVGPGWLGARAYEYRSGALCGSTAEAYNSGSTSLFGVGGVKCTNPSGTQTFETTGYHLIWSDQSDTYATGFTYSPRQSY